MKTLEEWIAIDESKEDDYTGATSMLGTVKNIVWQMLKNSRHGNRLAKAKTNPSNHSNQVRVWFSEKTLDDVAKFEKELNDILKTDPTPFSSIEYDPTRSGSKTYATWILNVRHALDDKTKSAFAKCGNLKLLEGGNSVQLCYALSSKNLLQTKDLDPTAFGLTAASNSGNSGYTEESLIAAVLNKCQEVKNKKDTAIALFERYIRKCIAGVIGNSSIADTLFNENALQISDITNSDLNCANKDFGEIVCALSVLHRTKGMGMTVVFPEAENEKLIDFKLISRDGLRYYYYSVKNKGKNKGTAGSILSKLWDEYAAANPFEKSNPDSKAFGGLVKLIDKGGGDTRAKLFSCANYIAKKLPSSRIASCLSGLANAIGTIGEGTPKMPLKFENVSRMLETAVKKVVEEAVSHLEIPKGKKSLSLSDVEASVYDAFFSGKGKPILDAMANFRKSFMNVPNETMESVYKMLVPGFKGSERKLMYPKYGLFVYPIGAQLARSLNEPVNGQPNQFLVALNKCLGWHKNFVQIDTDISISCKSGTAELVVVQPKWNRFSNSTFKFEYNGMSKNSGNNRPLNFIMEH